MSRTEAKAIKLFRKAGLTILPGELVESSDSVEAIEDKYSLYDKEIRKQKKKFQIYTYEKLVDSEGAFKRFIAILDTRKRRFIFSS